MKFINGAADQKAANNSPRTMFLHFDRAFVLGRFITSQRVNSKMKQQMSQQRCSVGVKQRTTEMITAVCSLEDVKQLSGKKIKLTTDNSHKERAEILLKMNNSTSGLERSSFLHFINT